MLPVYYITVKQCLQLTTTVKVFGPQSSDSLVSIGLPGETLGSWGGGGGGGLPYKSDWGGGEVEGIRRNSLYC